MANKEQKRSSREAKKPKQKKKGAEKRAAAKPQTTKALEFWAAAGLAAKLGTKAEIARELAYRLYTVSERKKRAAEALSYNGLVQSWPEITRLAREATTARPAQPQLI